MGDSDALLRVADEDGFDEPLILALEEELFGDVVGLFHEDDGIGKDLKMFGKFGAEVGGEVGHKVEGIDPFAVDPLKDLVGAEGGLAEVGEFVAQFVGSELEEGRFGVGKRHGESG